MFRKTSRSRFRRFPTRRRTRGRKAEVSNWATGFNLVAVPRPEEGGGSLLNPSIYVTEVMSLASLVTDTDVDATLTRSIPPHYRGVSVVKGSLDLDLCITAAPYSQVVEAWDHVNGKWAGGWLRGACWVYVDEFEYNTGTGLQEPDLNVVHPWQDDIIPGGVHTEFNRPKRLLYRKHFTMAGAVDITAGANPALQTHGLAWRDQLHVHLSPSFRKVYVDERQAIWLMIALANPWLPGIPVPDPHQIAVGIVGIGRIIYKLRAT